MLVLPVSNGAATPERFVPETVRDLELFPISTTKLERKLKSCCGAEPVEHGARHEVFIWNVMDAVTKSLATMAETHLLRAAVLVNTGTGAPIFFTQSSSSAAHMLIRLHFGGVPCDLYPVGHWHEYLLVPASVHFVPILLPHGEFAQSSTSTHPFLPMPLPLYPEGHLPHCAPLPGAATSVHDESRWQGLFAQPFVSMQTRPPDEVFTGLLL
jgi:hypothetical protein